MASWIVHAKTRFNQKLLSNLIGRILVKYGNPIYKEEVSLMNSDELRVKTRERFCDTRDIEKDEELVNSKYDKKWLWFLFFEFVLILHTYGLWKLFVIIYTAIF